MVIDTLFILYLLFDMLDYCIFDFNSYSHKNLK